MKSSFVQNEREGSLLNKVGRKGFNVTKRKSQALGASVHWMDSKFAGDMNTWPPVHVNAAKFTSTAYVLSRSGYFHKPRQTTGLPLPPINGSRSKANPISAHRLEPVKPQTSPGSVLTGKSMFGVYIGQGRTVILKSEPCNKIHMVVEAGSKASTQSASQPHDAFPSDPPIRPKKGISGPESNHRGGERDAYLTDPKQQKNFCSGDSAVETESDSSADKDGLQTLKEGGDDEYYNEQRISEWILKVNSCLFSKGEKELTEPTHAQEHDIATIKIIYSGE